MSNWLTSMAAKIKRILTIPLMQLLKEGIFSSLSCTDLPLFMLILFPAPVPVPATVEVAARVKIPTSFQVSVPT